MPLSSKLLLSHAAQLKLFEAAVYVLIGDKIGQFFFAKRWIEKSSAGIFMHGQPTLFDQQLQFIEALTPVCMV